MPTPAEGLCREDRIRRRSEFRRIQSGGRRVHTPHFIIVLSPRDQDGRRLGVTVTRKVANAVGRNRVKRLVREVFRRNRACFPEPCDIVVIAKRGAPELGYADVLDEVSRARGALRGAYRRAARGSEAT